jgi:hypothetical protein
VFSLVWVLGAAHKLHVLWLVGAIAGALYQPLIGVIARGTSGLFTGVWHLLRALVNSTFHEAWEPGRSISDRVWSLMPLVFVVCMIYGVIQYGRPALQRIETLFSRSASGAVQGAAADSGSSETPGIERRPTP